MNNFVYILGSGSKYDDIEIKYSIRSVLKHHPDADIKIVGETPSWHTGEGITYVPDDDFPAVSKWRKMEVACTLFDEFIQMDDDFYLLKPLKPMFYCQPYNMKHQAFMRGRGQTWYSKMVWSTADLFAKEPCYLVHTPLPVISSNFLEMAENYPQRSVSPSLSVRQAYCVYEGSFKCKVRGDVKGYSPKDDDLWSATPMIRDLSQFDTMFPTPSRFERQV